jgi:hypothetical protein
MQLCCTLPKKLFLQKVLKTRSIAWCPALFQPPYPIWGEGGHHSFNNTQHIFAAQSFLSKLSRAIGVVYILHKVNLSSPSPTPPSWGQILGRNADKSLKSFPSCYTQSPNTASPRDFYFFKFTQPLIVSTVQLLYTVKEIGGKPDRKPYPLPYGIRNPYRNLKSENSQDYAQKPHRNCPFMNSASGPHFPRPVASPSHIELAGQLNNTQERNSITRYPVAVLLPPPQTEMFTSLMRSPAQWAQVGVGAARERLDR